MVSFKIEMNCFSCASLIILVSYWEETSRQRHRPCPRRRVMVKRSPFLIWTRSFRFGAASGSSLIIVPPSVTLNSRKILKVSECWSYLFQRIGKRKKFEQNSFRYLRVLDYGQCNRLSHRGKNYHFFRPELPRKMNLTDRVADTNSWFYKGWITAQSWIITPVIETLVGGSNGIRWKFTQTVELVIMYTLKRNAWLAAETAVCRASI